MANLSPSLFTRLYGSIILAVLLSFALSQYATKSLMEQDAISDFVRDTNYIYTELKNSTEHSYKLNFPFANEFVVQWQPLDQQKPPCDLCKHLGEVNNIKVYELDDDRLLAVYPLLDLNVQLLISDALQTDTEQNDDDKIAQLTGLNVEEMAFVLFVFTALLVIAGSIYWPLRQLQKQINGLVAVNDQFGSGDLKVRANESLSKPLNQLAKSFNMMASAIADTVKENQIFAQAVPHEVRTPLSRIQLAAGLIRKTEESAQRAELVDNIDSYIDDINELIVQVVTFSKLNSTAQEEEASFEQVINAMDFVESRLASLKPDINITVQLQIDQALEIVTNPAYLRLLLDNLLKNAFSHTYSVIIIVMHQVGDTIEFSVEDDGPGIPLEQLETIFFPFARLDKSRSRKTGGLGLGLAIARAAGKRMKCDLVADNNPAGGARFGCQFAVDR